MTKPKSHSKEDIKLYNHCRGEYFKRLRALGATKRRVPPLGTIYFIIREPISSRLNELSTKDKRSAWKILDRISNSAYDDLTHEFIEDYSDKYCADILAMMGGFNFYGCPRDWKWTFIRYCGVNSVWVFEGENPPPDALIHGNARYRI